MSDLNISTHGSKLRSASIIVATIQWFRGVLNDIKTVIVATMTAFYHNVKVCSVTVIAIAIYSHDPDTAVLFYWVANFSMSIILN